LASAKKDRREEEKRKKGKMEKEDTSFRAYPKTPECFKAM
jgi:hypothetical protein